MKHLLTIFRTKNIFTLLAVTLLGFYADAQENKLNDRQSLNGTWEIIFDDKNEAVAKKWYLDKNFSKVASKKQITVPSCWEETEKNYEGVGIYRKKIEIPTEWKDRIIELHFEAVNYKTEIWLNDQVVGFHEGGYTPFSFRVDKLAKPGKENTLMLRVVSPIILTDKYIDGMGRQEVPMWRGAITGGIWQDVSIVSKGKQGLKDVFIKPNIHNNSTALEISIENTEATIETATLIAEIQNKEGKIVSTQSAQLNLQPGITNINWNFNLKNVHLWELDNPYLYNAKVRIVKNKVQTDQWSHKFGMREFSVADNKFTLNGNPIYLKGAFFEGLYPTKLGFPDSEEMAVKEIRLAKEAGFNMIRPWRKPAPKMWLDLCDEMGVLTVGSLVVECMHRPISSPRLPYVVENELRKTILKNRNRTCIIQWELFNEINRPILAQMLNSMSVLARDLDPTRMILDESGGWGEGANIYLPYEKTPTKFNDIHHYSGSQVNQDEFDGYIATARTKEDLKNEQLINKKSYGKHVAYGKMTYISELGYGSTPNLTENNKEFASKGNPIVAPTKYHKELNEGYIKTLDQTGFDKIYPNVTDFYLEQQKMHGIANKRMLEASRLNPLISGYCVHALVGGDWVLGAGLLDLWRNPKTDVYNMTKAANQPQIAPIQILPRNVFAQKGAVLKINGVSELPAEKITANIRIKSKKGKTVYQKTIHTELPSGISEILNTKLNTTNFKGAYTVMIVIKNQKGKTIIENTQSFDVFTAKDLKTPTAKIAVYDPSKKLTTFLTKKQIDYHIFDKNTSLNTTVFVGKANKKDASYKKQIAIIKDFVAKGGKAVFLEVLGEKIPGFNRTLKKVSKEALPLQAQMQGKWATEGGWAAKSHIVSKHPIFKGLPTAQIMHGVYENVHPETSMSKQEGKLIAGMIGYDHFPNNDIMVRHYNGTGEVWYAADVLEAEIGQGKMLLSTLKLIENLGTDPVAEKLLYNMINYTTK